MTWQRVDKYCLTNGTHYICRVNMAEETRVELWEKASKTLVSYRKAHTKHEFDVALETLKRLCVTPRAATATTQS